MKRLLFVLWLSPASGSSQGLEPSLDLGALCGERLQGRGTMISRGGAVRLSESPEGTLAFLDQGFCAAFLLSEEEAAREAVWRRSLPSLDALGALAPDSQNAVALPGVPAAPAKPRWKVRFYASHSFTTYFRSDIVFKSSRYDITVKDYEWAERSSREFFSPKTWRQPGNNPLQAIDEPTNTFVVSIERDGHEFFLSAFHPKFLQAPGQIKSMKGAIDGVPVDGRHPLDKPFDGYNQTPGESEIISNKNTHKQMAFEIGYGRRFVLLDSRRGSISYIPAVGVGVMVGENDSAVIQEGKWWDFDDYGDSYGVQGLGASLTNRVEFNGPKERFGIFYENKLSAYKQEHGFLDGTQKYDLKMMGNSVGVKLMLFNPENRKKRRLPSWAAVTP